MSQFATFDVLSSFNREVQEARLLKEASGSKIGKTVFLSHSSKDKEYLPALITILENNGGRVYVDNEDDRLPTNPNRKTAEILRDTVKYCRRFVLFVTTNSKDSIWIPWELGLADGEKGSRPVALFPVAERSYQQAWTETEYLGLACTNVLCGVRLRALQKKTHGLFWIMKKNSRHAEAMVNEGLENADEGSF